MTSLDTLVSFCKSKGFVYPGSEIYGGLTGSYTYGPLGVELKNNLKRLWWETFVHNRADIVGIDGDIILHPKTWHASGHVGGFNDQMVDCKNCKARIRADHLVEEALDIDCEGMSDEAVTALIRENPITCPKCGSDDFTDARQFNLMFQTQLSKTGEDSTAYLRPETAQAIFLEFKNVATTQRVKLPFGIAQQGKAFRNEITPGNFLFRRLEFEQMEIEYFFDPEEHSWEDIFTRWLDDQKAWCASIGLSTNNYTLLEHPQDKLSHYSKRTVDIEYAFPFGTKELYGLAYRTDFDLKQHASASGKEIIFNDNGKKIQPHVIEPTWGVDRSILAVLCDAYTEEQLEDESSRIVLKLKPVLAPYKVAVLPLMKKDGLAEKAAEVLKGLQVLGYGVLDAGGSIGKRYRRQDEVGTPVCVTVDYDTLEDQTVTVRDRDTMEQKRIPIADLLKYIAGEYYSA